MLAHSFAAAAILSRGARIPTDDRSKARSDTQKEISWCQLNMTAANG
ncbi:hypothetical protein QUB70_17440 [Microcoleus sp. A003_D6]